MTYAAKTTVTPGKTRDEIVTLLRKRGARDFELWENDHQARITFRMDETIFQLRLPLHGTRQEIASRWRVFLLNIKARLEFIAAGGTTFEQAFFTEVVLPSGETVGDHVGAVLQVPGWALMPGPDAQNDDVLDVSYREVG